MRELPLGKQVEAPNEYDPSILCPIPRAKGRASIDLTEIPLHGWDVWNAHELSWLDQNGRPQVGICRLHYSALSPNIIESKSLKLYFNSLYNTRFENIDHVSQVIGRDVAERVGSGVGVRIFIPPWGDASLSRPAVFQSIDTVPPSEGWLGTVQTQETIGSELLRSRCPVTGQPDWGTVIVEYEGRAIQKYALLEFIIGLREHQGFHEECCERIFAEIWRKAKPHQLKVTCLYTRRGGIDINPVRSSYPEEEPAFLRSARQ